MYASSFLFLGDGIVFSVFGAFGCAVVGSQRIATFLVGNIGRGKPKRSASYLVYIDSQSSSRYDFWAGLMLEQRSARQRHVLLSRLELGVMPPSLRPRSHAPSPHRRIHRSLFPHGMSA